jgi:hypothetical protein
MGRMIRALNSLRRITLKKLGMVIEAAIFLLLARLAIIMLPFRCLTWYFNRHIKQPELIDPERKRLRREVSWAIDRAALILPGDTVCFPRGIAAQAMLRRRRIATILYYGAATLPETGLTSHVWVQDGVNGVVGHNSSSDYIILARYPETRRANTI